MDKPNTPTLARLLQLLKELGFVSIPAKKGAIAYTHANSGAEFLFRDRELDTPARETELANMRIQLTYRGLLTNQEFDRFIATPIASTP